MKTIKAKISLLVLLLGLLLILANQQQNEKLFRERGMARIEREANMTGARLAGMMQHFLRRGNPRAAELEMSYAAVSNDLTKGLVCDDQDEVQFATRLEWRGMHLADTPLAGAAELVAESRRLGDGLTKWDEAGKSLFVVFPFFASYAPQDLGVVVLVYDSSHALATARDVARHESLVQGCVLAAVCLIFCVALDWLLRRRVEAALAYSRSVIVGMALPESLRGGDELAEIVLGFAEAVAKVHHTEALLLDATEAERLRIGRDIHDDVCQRLAAAQLKIGMLHSDLTEEQSAHAAFAAEIAAELRDAAATTRGFARGLVPVLMEREGLGAALQNLADQVARSFGVRCEMSCELGACTLAEWVQTHVFRITQELMVNACKHAQPTWVKGTLSAAEGVLRLQVENDGLTFTREQTHEGGLGLSFLRLRVSALGGHLTFQPRDDGAGGTLVLCATPLADRHFQAPQHSNPCPVQPQTNPAG